MSQKIVVGPIEKGYKTNPLAFYIDNDSFPTLINAYQWRGRVKRRRGTSLLGRLTRFFTSTDTAYGSTSSFNLVLGAGNLITAFSLNTLSPNATIVPGSVTFTDNNTGDVYTDLNKDGTLQGAPAGSGTINYATGAITVTGGAAHTITTVSFNYFPLLPVMGLEDLNISETAFPGNLGFDPVYSYNITTTIPASIFDVSFYNNPSASALLPGYTAKTVWTPTTWNGQTYQQFYTANYQGALWATNGINIPFNITNIGMQYKFITGVAITQAGNGTTVPAIASITIVAHGLVQGDFVFINEVGGITGINFQTGYVTSVTNANTVVVEFPVAILGGAYTSGGIAQYLTNRSDTTKDCLRWYNGAPVNATGVFTNNQGWVNFAPPLFSGLPSFGISDLPPAQYYLVGARMIIPFKDRLIFIGVVVQTSAAGSQIYLADTVICSQNGTPYYTCSFSGPPWAPTLPSQSLLTPTNQSGFAASYFLDVPGFGFSIPTGFPDPLTTVSTNEDVLIIGSTRRFFRFVYSGNDLAPFNFFIINSELGAGSTFSAITMDQSSLTIGHRGIQATSQISAARIDLDIPDSVFEIDLTLNGSERVTAQRDFINEWIYFTYRSDSTDSSKYLYPTETLQYNYRDNSWAIFQESYTTYGSYRASTGLTWATVGQFFPTWSDWNQPWNSGSSNTLQQKVIAGNSQGFIFYRDEGTGEASSLFIQSFTGSSVTVPDHCLRVGDYITISGALGTVGANVNGKIFTVSRATQNAFTLVPGIPSGTYLGGGLIKKMYPPFIQTKQFPVSWGMARKTRIGPQQYLFTTTNVSQITLLIYLSQNAASPYNTQFPYTSPIVPQPGSPNGAIIYSSVLFTCPESTNIGLTPANTNLNLITAPQQAQTWHRMNTSLIGDTVQIGFSLSDAQMRDTTFANQFAEIELHGFILDVSPSQLLA